MHKKGISPVIGSVLLIAIVVVLAGIIFFWASGFIALAPIGSSSCGKVNFEAGIFCDSGSGTCELEVLNRGNVELQGFVLKQIGSAETRILSEDVLEEPILPGASRSLNTEINIGFIGKEILVVPMVLSGEESFICGDEYGFEVVVS